MVMRFVKLAGHVGHHGLEQPGMLHRFGIHRLEQYFAIGHVRLERRAKVKRNGTQVACEYMVVQIQQFAQLGRKTLGILQVLHAQGAPGNLVFIGWSNATAGGADLGIAAFFTCSLTRHVQCGMKRQYQRAGLTDTQARTQFHTHFFQAFNFLEQLGCRQHDAVADVAFNAGTHDAAGNKVQRGFDSIDHQGVTCVVAALKPDHALRTLGEPVHQLAFALVAPLGANDNYISTFGCFHFALLK